MSATNTDWTVLQQAEDMAYFKADLCCYSPESYSLDEKKEICNEMVSTSKAMLDALRADFEQRTASRDRVVRPREASSYGVTSSAHPEGAGAKNVLTYRGITI